MTDEEELIIKDGALFKSNYFVSPYRLFSDSGSYGLGPSTLKNENEAVLEAVSKAKESILAELQLHHKKTEVRFATVDSANMEIIRLQQEVFEKTKNIEDLNKDTVKLLKLLKTDISNPKQIQLYNIEMFFGIGIIAFSIILYLFYQSRELLILFLITGIGIFATSFVSKRKILEIRNECDTI